MNEWEVRLKQLNRTLNACRPILIQYRRANRMLCMYRRTASVLRETQCLACELRRLCGTRRR